MTIETIKEGAVETLDQALVQLINKTVSGVDTASNFLVEQTPDIIQQLLLWYGVSSILLTAVGALGLYGIYRLWKNILGTKDNANHWAYETSSYSGTSLRVEVVIIGGIGSFIGGVFCIASILRVFTALKVFIAPKIWLIEYAANLVKTVS